MVRRRSTPPIHRWSRKIIAAIAAIGVLETAYLTIAKLTGNAVICPTSGCEKVLNSPYATIGGILPLSLLGLVAYLAIAILAVAPLTVNPETNKGLRSKLENSTWLLIFVLATAMLIFSGYLMYLMLFQIGDFCIYCISSAVFAIAIFVLTLFGREWEDIGQLFFTGTLVAMVATIATLGLYNSNSVASSNSSSPGEAAPAVTTVSGSAEIALARHLKQIGAREYGAYWCPHCHEQKELFGNEAASLLDYVECDPKGKNARPQLCETAKIQGFPSWIINGKLYAGTKSLEELAEASGYTGPRNFKNAP